MVPNVEAAVVQKALAWQSRSAAKDVGDLCSLMAIVHQDKARLAGWKLGTAQGGTRGDAAREFYVLVTMIDPQQRIDGLTMPTARFGALVRAHICELMTGRQPICSDVAVLCGRRTDTSRRDLKASHTSSCTATRAEVGRIPEGGGWRAHGKGFDQAKAVERAKAAGARAGYVYLHSAVDGYSRLAYTEALTDEKASTAVGFMHRARVFFAAHGIGHINRIITDNGSCYCAKDFAKVLHGARHQRINPYTPRHNDKVERYNFDPVRGIPLRPNLDQRAAALTSSRSVERALQLPSTSHCRRKPATREQAPRRCHQRYGLIQLAVGPALIAQPSTLSNA
jgi:hypothetical protein